MGLKVFFKNLKIYFKKLFTKKITKPLSWSPQDFKSAKKWAQLNYHPNHPDRTVWEVYNRTNLQSEEILYEINKLIFIKK